MPKFLNTAEVFSEIESIILGSKDVLVLITPYISTIPDSIIQKLRAALSKRVRVVMIFRSLERIHPNEIEKMASLEGMELFYNPNLHAKAYYNEREAVITSFNLSGYSQTNNIEFGIHITRSESKEMFDRLVTESREMFECSKMVRLKKNIFTIEEITEGIFDANGYCIRCGDGINFDYRRPLCPECFDVWRMHNNQSFVENYCHFCGEENRTTFAKPICRECHEDLEVITIPE